MVPFEGQKGLRLCRGGSAAAFLFSLQEQGRVAVGGGEEAVGGAAGVVDEYDRGVEEVWPGGAVELR